MRLEIGDESKSRVFNYGFKKMNGGRVFREFEYSNKKFVCNVQKHVYPNLKEFFLSKTLIENFFFCEHAIFLSYINSWARGLFQNDARFLVDMKTREFDREGVEGAVFDLLERCGIGEDALKVNKMNRDTVNGTHIVASFLLDQKRCGDIFGGFRNLCEQWIKELEKHCKFLVGRRCFHRLISSRIRSFTSRMLAAQSTKIRNWRLGRVFICRPTLQTEIFLSYCTTNEYLYENLSSCFCHTKATRFEVHEEYCADLPESNCIFM